MPNRRRGGVSGPDVRARVASWLLPGPRPGFGRLPRRIAVRGERPEGGVDERGLLREPPAVLGRPRPLADAAAQLQLQREQLAQQARAVGLRGLGQMLLDPRPPAGPPLRLEPVAGGDDPPEVGQRCESGPARSAPLMSRTAPRSCGSA